MFLKMQYNLPICLSLFAVGLAGPGISYDFCVSFTLTDRVTCSSGQFIARKRGEYR